LGGVLAQADLALAEVDTGRVPKEQLENIRGVAIRGAGIVRQLLIYSGQETAVLEPVDLSSLIRDMSALLKVVVSKYSVLKTDFAELPLVRANPAQLRQVVMNLLTNASEAIGEQDGEILIRTLRRGPDTLTAGSRESVVLEVSDTGCGMTPEVRSKIFEPFFSTKSEGHGLGLAVVQRIVRGLEGTIQLESEPGRGTTVRIVLPCLGEPAGKSSSNGNDAERLDVRVKTVVLVVEDEVMLRVAVAKLLNRAGFSILEAGDGHEALKIVREYEGQIAAVLLDVTLPGAPSREVFAETRRLRPTAKVIVTSAYGQKTVTASFPGLEIESFLQKPYQLSDLISLLQKLTAGTEEAQVAVRVRS
jgi:CheY-like chemotaxis protein/two-component sensor histidine kinase